MIVRRIKVGLNEGEGPASGPCSVAGPTSPCRGLNLRAGYAGQAMKPCCGSGQVECPRSRNPSMTHATDLTAPHGMPNTTGESASATKAL